MFFDDVRVPIENVVGELNGGWKIANALLARAPARRQSAEMRRRAGAPEEGRRRSGRRKVRFSATSSRPPRSKCWRSSAAYEHAVALTRSGRQLGPELLVPQACRQRAHANPSPPSRSKPPAATALCWSRLVVGNGAVHPSVAFLQSRRETIFAGSSEIQRNIIAKRVLNLP